MTKNIFKEIIVFLFIISFIIIGQGVLFYNKVPNIKSIQEPKQYTTSQTLIEIIGEPINIEQNLTSEVYEVNERDLTNLKKQNLYKEGKSNPFLEYTAEATQGQSER